VVALVVTLAVVGIYGWWWQPYIAQAMSRDQLTSYYWESGIENLLGKRLPPFLDPATPPGLGHGFWVRMSPDPAVEHPQDPQVVNGQGAAQVANVRKIPFHYSQRSQFWVTVAFAIMFVGMVGAKSSGSASGRPKVTIEGHLEVDSAGKVKVSD
jgi:hypothetical protein